MIRQSPKREADVLPNPLGFVVAKDLETRNSTSRTELAESLGDLTENQTALRFQQLQEFCLDLWAANVAHCPNDVAPILVRLAAALQPGEKLRQPCCIACPRDIHDFPSAARFIALVKVLPHTTLRPHASSRCARRWSGRLVASRSRSDKRSLSGPGWTSRPRSLFILSQLRSWDNPVVPDTRGLELEERILARTEHQGHVLSFPSK